MYVIVDTKCFSVQVSCATLHDVITYLVEKTEGQFVPLIIEEVYEKSICTSGTVFHLPFIGSELIFNRFCLPSAFVRSDNENGEKSVEQAPVHPVPPPVPAKPGRSS